MITTRLPSGWSFLMREIVYREFSQEDLDAAYDNTRAVFESAKILEGFEIRSAEIAAAFPDTMDIPYGTLPREKIDYFPGNSGSPILVFIHGGYWQMRRKETFRFLAKGPLSLGFHVASVGYTLAPNASLTEIVQEIRSALDFLRKNAGRFAADVSRIFVSGWSAGAHLAVSVLSEESVRGALAISGIYDLLPISKSYLNKALSFSECEIQNLSPMRSPCIAKPVVVACGADELPELRRQSLEFAELRARERIPGYFAELPGKNHFSILEELENPNGILTLLLRILSVS